ncbi:lipopolysaccharide biosynthesis protein [Bradyrhizobium sp. 24]|uniref:lipopolysaccharide biosynthesis protein n=1 Tax=unclassified Bradyrhizobium TaxID=2631580 RepID=UPI001FFC2459|nr:MULTISPECIES: lipopolysaccharide biosynthesis protein [unclassified Bradyrhizobium]MCK1297355.1 lipopolysaccharide biosynthesis protein [Bradyrhizobium sp. 37]MCK1377497.1 lipopolysaccharide biosynthesis protein [Bradyrhizobium sp. 24]MCK1769361.1 lipopolysaccharide biosynthesis protein [Bradyrhizobium sp. 134]
MNVTPGKQHQVVVALLWSLAQNWGGRALSFVLFLILARLLNPADFGLAALVGFILLLLSSISEFGFGDALIQRRALEPTDVTLPFFCSLAASALLAVLIALLATDIERWLGVKGLAPLLTAASLSLPIGTATLFQEALYKRQMDFRVLALRTMVATAISGVVGIACAYAGFGALSLVIQVVVQSAVSGLWLWSQPRWLPMRGYDLKSLRELSGYSIHVVSNRLLDFAIVRTIDMIILSLYGVAALGIYTVGARVYIILMQLLTQAVMDVALSALSKIAHERHRIADAYLRSVSLGALIGSPVFVLLAAIAPEFSLLLFGSKWAGSEAVMRPLMLIGAIQTVQFVNSAYFGAMGKPNYVFLLNILKFATVVPAMFLLPSRDIGQLATIFAVAQLVVTPVTFALALRLLGLSWNQFLRPVAGCLCAILLAYGAVALCREATPDMNPYLRIGLLSSCFGATYLMSILLFWRKQLFSLIAFVVKRGATA